MRFQAMDCADNAPVALFTCERSGELSYANSAYEELFGGGHWIDRVVEEEREVVQAGWKRALAEKTNFEAFCRFRVDPDPSREPVSLQILCRSKGSGQPFTGTVRPLPYRDNDRRMLRVLIDTLPDLIYVKDLQSRFLVSNLAHARLFGFENPEEIKGKCDHDFFEKAIADQCRNDELAAMADDNAVRNREEMIPDADGHMLWILTTKVPWIDGNGEPGGIVGVGRDITELKRSQLELERTARQLEEANRELALARDQALESARTKAQFLANMSHEVRTPMNGIIGMAELLLDTVLTPEQADFVQTIGISGQSLLTVINDILDFSKIEAGQLHMESTELRPSCIVGDVLRLYATGAESKGVRLVSEVSPSADLVCLGDPVRLRQILSNLVSNSIKFTDSGYVLVKAEVGELRGGRVPLHMTVKDTGIGIPPERIGAIFESFTQVDASTTRRFGGTGLGLTICRQLVQLMDGEIEVESVEGEGSEFHVTIWLLPSKQQTPFIEPDLSDLHVLVCDDLEVNRRVLEGYLAGAGCHVECVGHAPEVVDLVLGGRKVDLLLLDFMMPDLNGIEVARAIAEADLPQKPKIVLLTSAGYRPNESERREVGISACLDKPTVRTDLLNAIALAVSRRDQPKSEFELTKNVGARLGLRVLLAEDNEVNAKVAVRMLERLGCEVTVVPDGHEAVRLAFDRFDVVLMDCQMPVMDGYEATRQIRRKERATGNRIPIIALTANALDEHRRKSFRSGMDDHLSKPFSISALADVLGRHAVSAAA